MIEVTNGTLESYGLLDWTFGSDSEIDDIPDAHGLDGSIQYNQTEFKTKSRYCTFYMWLGMYSGLTGEEVKKETRESMLKHLLENRLIIDGVGGYLDKVVAECTKIAPNYGLLECQFLQVPVSSDKDNKLKAKRYPMGSGAKRSSAITRDSQDDGVLDDPDAKSDSMRGHAFCTVNDGKDILQNTYFGSLKYNRFDVRDYESRVNNTASHFLYGYILTELPKSLYDEMVLRQAKRKYDLYRALRVLNRKKKEQGLTFDETIKLGKILEEIHN